MDWFYQGGEVFRRVIMNAVREGDLIPTGYAVMILGYQLSQYYLFPLRQQFK